jgi:hypothetical protein
MDDLTPIGIPWSDVEMCDYCLIQYEYSQLERLNGSLVCEECLEEIAE